jgi:Alpha galactosidase A/Alpha galactosidase C-terminal beta sandwich domain
MMRRALALLACLFTTFDVIAQGTAFFYQGRLIDNSQPANGTYDLTFTLCSSSNQPGNNIAGTITNLGTTVTAGLFTATLDFGSVFDGAPRWLEIGVRTNGVPNFIVLTPRQPISSVPYAIFAGTATNLVGALSPANIAPLTSLITSSSNGLYSSLNSSWSTDLAGPTNSGIISSNDYAKLNSFPDAFEVVSPLPPVVLNTWYFGGCQDFTTTNTMKTYATNGILAMAKKYNTAFYYVIDDLWMDRTNVPNGILVPDPNWFPNGMKVMADQAHALGMKFGLYQGSNGYHIYCTNLYGNATNMIAWGVDYLKFELGYPGGPVQDAYMISTMLYPFWTNGHPVFVESGCGKWSPSYTGLVQSPRCLVDGDATDYHRLMAILDYTRTFSEYTIGQGRGFFPSVDYVNNFFNADEQREHWTAEAMIPAAWGFSLGTNDLVSAPVKMQSLTNEDVFSINQDPLVSPGFLVSSNFYVNVYERRCVSKTVAISVENRNSFATNYTLWFTNLPGVDNANLIRDCWAHTNCVAKNSFTITVNAHSAALLRFTPMGDVLTNIIAVNWPDSVVTSTTINGIQTIGYGPMDPDTRSYILRSGITNNPTEMLVAAEAVCLGKEHGWWTNWDALYLFRGSTSNSTAQNLVSTNYNIVWSSSGVTFGWNGVTGDGTTGCGDTRFNPTTASQPQFGLNSASLFVYNRTATPTGTGAYQALMGVNSFPGAGLYCNTNSRLLGLFGLNASIAFDNVNLVVEPDSHDFSGFILANRYAANFQTIFHNQFTGNTIDFTLATTLPDRTFYIFGANGGGLNPSGCNLALAGFGGGMTPTQWLTFQSDMKTLLSILGL